MEMDPSIKRNIAPYSRNRGPIHYCECFSVLIFETWLHREEIRTHKASWGPERSRCWHGRSLMIAAVWVTKERKWWKESVKYLKAGWRKWDGKISLIGRVFFKKHRVGKWVGGIWKEEGRRQVTTSTRCCWVNRSSLSENTLLKLTVHAYFNELMMAQAFTPLFLACWQEFKYDDKDRKGLTGMMPVTGREKGSALEELWFLSKDIELSTQSTQMKQSTHATSVWCLKFDLKKTSSQCQRISSSVSKW